MRTARITALALLALAAPAVAALPSEAAAPVMCHGRAATIIGTAGDDRLTGTSGADVIAGLGGDDNIKGGGGDDVICGGDGSDSLFGGRGDDRLAGDAGLHSVLLGGAGDDHLQAASLGSKFLGGPGDDVMVSSSTRVVRLFSEPGNDTMATLAPTRVDLFLLNSPVGVRLDAHAGTLTGRGHTRLDLAPGTSLDVEGSLHADVLIGTPQGDALRGEGGNDVIEGRRGNDGLDGGRGDNTLRGGSGADDLGENVFSGYGANVAYGGAGGDRLHFTGNDDVYGGSGDDYFQVPFVPGSDAVVDGGAGHNTLVTHLKNGPSGGWHHVLVDLTKGRVDADGDVSRFSGIFRILDLGLDGADSWTVNGTNRHDVIGASVGKSAPAVVVHGRGGGDVIVTGAGDDTLYGGSGNDHAYAGDGTDTCYSIEGPIPPQSTTGCETSTP